jgi:hypothetical protein
MQGNHQHESNGIQSGRTFSQRNLPNLAPIRLLFHILTFFLQLLLLRRAVSPPLGNRRDMLILIRCKGFEKAGR